MDLNAKLLCYLADLASRQKSNLPQNILMGYSYALICQSKD